MTETETKITVTSDEAPTTTPPAVPTSESTSPALAKEDIPAADADVKDTEAPAVLKKVETTEKAPSERKDPREDPVGWINSLIPGVAHKVNYQLLDWAQQLAIEDEDKRQILPGKNDAVTKNQFLSFLRDGTLLAKLANRLQPGAIETVHEGNEAKDKAKQTSNINAFINFAKEKAGLHDDQVFSTADLQDKGKAGYQAVFNTLMRLGLKAQNTFEQKGFDIDQAMKITTQVAQTNVFQTILNFFRRARPNQAPKQLAKEAEKKEKSEKAAAVAAGEKVVEEKGAVEEEACKKIDAQAEQIETPAIAAH